ncbi:MAG TPA: ATP-binding protein [Candidatus Binatia bacterium]|jgi:signal transduction histidine kinase|nr:ATP-binding protein [Candidatus Binatia bacterium]
MLDYQTMSGGIKLRLAAFVLAIGGMVALIAWTAHSAWQRGGALREKLTAVQLKSFQIADHVQQTILELNNLVLRYGVYQDTNDWAHFETASHQLDLWIDEQRPIESTEKEKQIHDQINAAYDDYMAAARQIAAKARARRQRTPDLEDFAAFEKQSQRMLNLGFKLAGAHGESMDSFLAASQQSLSYLRWLSMTSLALLLLAGGGLAAVVYRELLAPLRVKLVQSQALMERQEKLASLGMLAAGVAHEIRNPLTAIKAWLFIQRKQMQPGTAEQADAEIIANEVTRLEHIVKDVLLFARPSEPHLATVAAEEPLRKVQTLLTPQLEKIGIRLALENSVNAQIRVDSQQIQQVLINLIQNSAESIGHRGTVTLRVRTGTGRLRERISEVVILEVCDTGKGIPPDVEKRLFDPFFTTKDAGTGLGLSIAARIVEKHGGALQYQTAVNRGTTFGVVLPRVNIS